jgi:penicillin-binding protein 2
MRRVSDYVKMSLAVLLVLTFSIYCSMRLLKVQVVESESYNHHEVVVTEYTQKIPSTRGEIVDASGLTIISNHVSYAVAIDEKDFPSDYRKGNAVILELLEILMEAGVEWKDSLPITTAEPYEFKPDSTEFEISAMKKSIGVNAYATAENCIDILISDYEISGEYTTQQQRMIAGIRYSMLDRDFSMSNRFEVAASLPMDLVSRLSELSMRLHGITVVQQAERVVEVGDVIPHEIGTVGPIFAENAAEYLEQGYDLNATVGISGIEKAMESSLQGKDGVRTITFEDGNAVSDVVTEEMVAGNTVMLTVNAEFQRGLQEILENFIANFASINKKPEIDSSKVKNGAIVVLDAKTGAILGEATCPTYNLLDYSELYDELIAAEGNPLFNRATQGLYRPGSTFKTITATAGLNEGVINGGTAYLCEREYFYIDTKYKCTGHHNYISVAPALKVSCNAFFYDLSRALTIDRIEEYATYYGIGQNTGIETKDSAGYMATPEKYHEMGMQWTVGQVLQAGIGNNEIAATPLQLACVANTIANEGVRYEPYLVDSIWDYSMEECISKTEPKVAERIELNYSYVYDYIEQGMIAASTSGMPAKYSLGNLGYSVAIKTGTPQQDSREQDSVFIGYAPANDPQIAFAGIIEGGEYSKYMIRDILKLYEEVIGME